MTFEYANITQDHPLAVNKLNDNNFNGRYLDCTERLKYANVDPYTNTNFIMNHFYALQSDIKPTNDGIFNIMISRNNISLFYASFIKSIFNIYGYECYTKTNYNTIDLMDKLNEIMNAKLSNKTRTKKPKLNVELMKLKSEIAWRKFTHDNIHYKRYFSFNIICHDSHKCYGKNMWFKITHLKLSEKDLLDFMRVSDMNDKLHKDCCLVIILLDDKTRNSFEETCHFYCYRAQTGSNSSSTPQTGSNSNSTYSVKYDIFYSTPYYKHFIENSPKLSKDKLFNVFTYDIYCSKDKTIFEISESWKIPHILQNKMAEYCNCPNPPKICNIHYKDVFAYERKVMSDNNEMCKNLIKSYDFSNKILTTKKEALYSLVYNKITHISVKIRGVFKEFIIIKTDHYYYTFEKVKNDKFIIHKILLIFDLICNIEF
jgi:hypothetical protein